MRWGLDEAGNESLDFYRGFLADEDIPQGKMGPFRWGGLWLNVENPTGSVRKGSNPDGSHWATTFKLPYGEITGTEGVDGDATDCFVGPLPAEDTQTVYVVLQGKPGVGGFDEDKVMLGFASGEDARAAYLEHYDDPAFFGGLVEIPKEQFVSDVLSGKIKGKSAWSAYVEGLRGYAFKDNPQYRLENHRYHKYTPELHSQMRDFVLEKWRERAGELGREEQPNDLSGACKFASLFAQGVVGGKLEAHRDHTWVRLEDGRVVDITDGVDSKDYTAHPTYMGQEWKQSLATCKPRVKRWREEWARRSYATFNDHPDKYRLEHSRYHRIQDQTQPKHLKLLGVKDHAELTGRLLGDVGDEIDYDPKESRVHTFVDSFDPDTYDYESDDEDAKPHLGINILLQKAGDERLHIIKLFPLDGDHLAGKAHNHYTNLAESYQNRGLGTRLYKTQEAFYRQLGLRESTAYANDHAAHVLKKLGYSEGERDIGEHRWMTKKLTENTSYAHDPDLVLKPTTEQREGHPIQTHRWMRTNFTPQNQPAAANPPAGRLPDIQEDPRYPHMDERVDVGLRKMDAIGLEPQRIIQSVKDQYEDVTALREYLQTFFGHDQGGWQRKSELSPLEHSQALAAMRSEQAAKAYLQRLEPQAKAAGEASLRQMAVMAAQMGDEYLPLLKGLVIHPRPLGSDIPSATFDFTLNKTTSHPAYVLSHDKTYPETNLVQYIVPTAQQAAIHELAHAWDLYRAHLEQGVVPVAADGPLTPFQHKIKRYMLEGNGFAPEYIHNPMAHDRVSPPLLFIAEKLFGYRQKSLSLGYAGSYGMRYKKLNLTGDNPQANPDFYRLAYAAYDGRELPTVLTEYALYKPEALYALREATGIDVPARINDYWGTGMVSKPDNDEVVRLERWLKEYGMNEEERGTQAFADAEETLSQNRVVDIFLPLNVQRGIVAGLTQAGRLDLWPGEIPPALDDLEASGNLEYTLGLRIAKRMTNKNS